MNTLVLNGADPSIVNKSGQSAKTIGNAVCILKDLLIFLILAEDNNLNLLTTVTRRAFKGTTSEQTTSERN
jgi:hypothetical protein